MGSSTTGALSIPVTYLMKVAMARKQYLAGVVKANRMGSVWAESGLDNELGYKWLAAERRTVIDL